MKKLLLAGTAIAGLAVMPSAAHAEIDLDVGGYYFGYLGYVDQDNDAGLHDFDWKREAEIHFGGETTLDNGLTVGVKVELEAENQSGGTEDTIDESYIYFAGNWGKAILGSENSAPYLLQVTAPAADEYVDGYDPKMRFINHSTTAEFNYAQSWSNDSDVITYLTPKFNGFQAGVTYSPANVNGENENIGDSLAGMESDDDSGDYEDLIEAGFRYDGEFEGVGIAFGAGYTTADRELEAAGQDDYQEYNVGLALTFDAFTIGAVYNTDNDGLDGSNEDDIYVIGADYVYGPYTFGASYFHSESENGAGTVEDELDRYSIGATYEVGPGITFRGSVNVYDIDDNTPTNDNDAVSVLLGTAILF